MLYSQHNYESRKDQYFIRILKCEFKCIARNVSVVCTLKELSLNKNTSIKQINYVYVFDLNFLSRNRSGTIGVSQDKKLTAALAATQ